MITISVMPPMTEPAIIPGILPEKMTERIFKHIHVCPGIFLFFIFLSSLDLISVLMSHPWPSHHHPLIHSGM